MEAAGFSTSREMKMSFVKTKEVVNFTTRRTFRHEYNTSRPAQKSGLNCLNHKGAVVTRYP